MTAVAAGGDARAGLEAYRAVRHELEAAVLPLATSVDGRRFSFQASLHGLALRVGGHVMLEHDGRSILGQVQDLRAAAQEAGQVDLGSVEAGAARGGLTLRYAAGAGAVLARDALPFHDATLRPATADEIRAGLEGDRRAGIAQLPIGELALAPGVGYGLHAGGFDRHTFLCGQSGSGKTYALGKVLERLLLDTQLRIVVLDPNSDFVRLGELRAGSDPEDARRYAAVAGSVEVHSTAGAGSWRLRLRLADLEPAAQAALLRLDPIRDRAEYAELVALLEAGTPPTVAALEATGTAAGEALALRVRNLGSERLSVWARGEAGSVLDRVTGHATRCTVVDLGSLPEPDEQALVAGAVLDRLWSSRTQREPVLVVIDEAHNICPARAEDPLTALATAHAVRIAAEGRKFGIYLLVSTQRPQKLHENVLTQCDNLMLMRLNSRADLAYVREAFSFVPAGLVEQAPTFGLGEALIAGKIAPQPALVRMGTRLSEEGGSDVPATWAVDHAG